MGEGGSACLPLSLSPCLLFSAIRVDADWRAIAAGDDGVEVRHAELGRGRFVGGFFHLAGALQQLALAIELILELQQLGLSGAKHALSSFADKSNVRCGLHKS